jgi:Domain of unknown function (DUF1844)
MEEGDEKDKGFKIQDRRRFSAEGEPRTEVEDKPAADPSPASGAAAQEAPPQMDKTAAATARAQYAGAQRASDADEINFSNFVVGLSLEALAALGEIPDPSSGQRRSDLRAAQQFIDIIGMLREKTNGNLDRDEEMLVETILFDLRMKYVELARPPGR